MTTTRPTRPGSGGAETTAHVDFLEARLALPAPPHSHVLRPRLQRALDADDDAPLVLVSAPAGSGKSTLVAEWIRQRRSHGRTSGWVTFEPGERGLWPLVVECLRRMGAPVPDLTGVGHGRQPAWDDVTAWAARLAGADHRWTVVVDGYEMTALPEARRVDHLLRESAGNLRLVLVSRVDPVLPLHRFRLDDALVEVRIADLAFTDEEVRTLFSAVGVRLGDESLRQLNARLGGWAAGLRFVARAITAHRADPERAVSLALAQAGDLNEYLLTEVLDQQSPEERRLMLDASVPDVLTADLIDAVLGPGAARPLAELARANAFIQQVPDQPSTYRYFPFFRDLLRAQLAHEAPAHSRRLHGRTANWLRQQGLVEQGLTHLALSGDWELLALTLVESVVLGRLSLDGEAGLLQVGRQVPRDATGPAAALVRAALALAAGDWAESADEIELVGRLPRLPGESGQILRLAAVVLAAIRSSLTDDVSTAARRLEVAEEMLEEAPPYLRGATLAPALGFAAGRLRLREGDLQAAELALTDAVAGPLASSPRFRAACLGHLALVHAWSGRLAVAERLADEAVALGGQASPAEEVPSAAPRLALARVALERYQVPSARAGVDAVMLCRTLPLDGFLSAAAEGVRAGVERAEGRLMDARSRLVRAAESAAVGEPWTASCLRAQAAEVSIAAGNAEKALGELAGVTERSREVALATAAAMLEHGGATAAGASLEEARGKATSTLDEVRLLLLEAGQRYEQRSDARAREILDRSLRIAAQEQLRRPFREAGPSVHRIFSLESPLLRQHSWLTKSAAGTSSSPSRPSSPPAERASGPGWSQLSSAGLDVVLPLTAKELEVLGHLDELLTTEEIAEKMFVSVNTIRTHIRSILRKLGVSRRNAAVRKARQLGMLSG